MIQKRSENFLNEKKLKIVKQALAFKGYASANNVEILNSFNSQLQVKDTEFAIKNDLTKLLSELRAFKFVTNYF